MKTVFYFILLMATLFIFSCRKPAEDYYCEAKVIDSVWISPYSKVSTLSFEPIYMYRVDYQIHATKRKVNVGDTVYYAYFRN